VGADRLVHPLRQGVGSNCTMLSVRETMRPQLDNPKEIVQSWQVKIVLSVTIKPYKEASVCIDLWKE